MSGGRAGADAGSAISRRDLWELRKAVTSDEWRVASGEKAGLGAGIGDCRFKSGGGDGARNWRLQIQDSGRVLRKVGWIEAAISTN